MLSVPRANLPALQAVCDDHVVELCDLGTFGTPDRSIRLLWKGTEVGSLDTHFMHDGIPTPTRTAIWDAAWAAAETRSVPVLGICRGFQAMNAFSGGKLVQHVDGHAGAGWGHGPAHTHPLRLVPGTRLARILSPTNPGGGVLTVNSYHHQAVRRCVARDGGNTPGRCFWRGAGHGVRGGPAHPLGRVPERTREACVRTPLH